MRYTPILAALGLIGCSGSTYTYGGYQIDDHMPLDGQRSWEYANNDTSVQHKIEVQMNSTPRDADGLDVYTFTFYNESTSGQIGTVEWSSDSIDGVQIHSYSYSGADASGGGGGDTGGGDTGDTGGASVPPPATETVTFDPPLVFADEQMSPGESIETTTGGWTFTSTFESVEPCPNHWVGEEWTQCLHFRVDDGDGDDSTGAWVAGDYWMVPRYGIAWFQNTGDTDNWVLVKAKWEAL